MSNAEPSPRALESALYDVEANDPESAMVDRSALSETDVQEIGELMAAFGRLRDAEDELSEASQQYMQLGKTDMRALHYLIVARHSDAVVTAKEIAAHLGISSASTTKLLDRLEAAHHITRSPHPTDRRALAINVTDETREPAMGTVGKLQAQRFVAAMGLSSKERKVIRDFLEDVATRIHPGGADWADQK